MADLQDRAPAQHATAGIAGEALARGGAQRTASVASVVQVTAKANRPRSAR